MNKERGTEVINDYRSEEKNTPQKNFLNDFIQLVNSGSWEGERVRIKILIGFDEFVTVWLKVSGQQNFPAIL